jgi:hypothetical protein
MGFNERVLSGNPFAELGFKGLFAMLQPSLGLPSLKGLVMLGRQNDGVELACFLYENRFAFGLGAETAKSVLGFGGGDVHFEPPIGLAILAILVVLGLEFV